MIHFDETGNFKVETQIADSPAIGQNVCILTTTTAANIRVAPDAQSERVDGITTGQRLLAFDKVDGWWQLAVGSKTAPIDESICHIRVIYVVNLRSQPSAESDWLATISADDGALPAFEYAFNEADQLRWWHLETGEWVREDFVEANAACDQVPLAGG